MAQEYNMEIGSFLRFSMENAKRHWLKFFGVLIAGTIALTLITVAAFKVNSNIGVLVLLLGIIGFSFGVFANVIRLASNRSFEIKAFIPDPMVFLNFILGMLLMIIVVAIGLVLLIIPGIILGLMLTCVPFLIVDKKMNFIAAFVESIKLTKGHLMDIFIGMFVTNLVISLFSIPVITLFFTIPMQVFAWIFPYVQLAGIADAPPAAQPASEAPVNESSAEQPATV